MSKNKVPVYTDNGEVYAYTASSEPTDVLGTVIEAFSNNTEVPKDGDTLQVTLDKLYTSDKTITAELGTVKAKVEGLPPTFTEAEVKNTKLTGFSLKSGKIAASDTILSAFEKTQQQFDSIPAPFTAVSVPSEYKISGTEFLQPMSAVYGDFQ